LRPFDVFKREITIKASFINPYTLKRAVSLLGSHRIDVNSLITDVVKLEDINKVFATDFYKGKRKIIK
jgi:L-iditol 2-dehydrogenase